MNNRLSNINQTPPAVDEKVRAIVRKHGLFPTPAILSAIQEALQTNQSRPAIPFVEMAERERVILVVLVQELLRTQSVIEILRDVSYRFATLASSSKIPVNGTETMIAVEHLANGHTKPIAVCSVTFVGGRMRHIILYSVSTKTNEILVQ